MAEVVETEEQEIVEEESEEEIPEEVQIEDTEGILTFTKMVNDLVEVIATTEESFFIFSSRYSQVTEE